MSRVRVLRAAAALGLAVLLGGLTLPLLGLALAGEPASFCCSKGRCCCADETAGTDDRACLRRGCGCEHPDATAAGAPLRIEAVLPAAALPVTVTPSRGPLGDRVRAAPPAGGRTARSPAETPPPRLTSTPETTADPSGPG